MTDDEPAGTGDPIAPGGPAASGEPTGRWAALAPPKRAALVAVVLGIALLGGFLLLRAGGDDGSVRTSEGSTTTSTTKKGARAGSDASGDGSASGRTGGGGKAKGSRAGTGTGTGTRSGEKQKGDRPARSTKDQKGGAVPTTTAPPTTGGAAPAVTGVQVAPSEVHQGDLVTITVTVADRPAASVVAIAADATGTQLLDDPDRSPACSGGTAADRATATSTFQRAFKVAGAHDGFAVVTTCDGAVLASSSLHVDVQAGSAPTNGPEAPTAAVTPGGAAGAPALQIDSVDPDGQLVAVVVDWGDGTTDEVDLVPDPAAACDASTEYAPDRATSTVAHSYATAGPHHVTVTVRSAGCAGADTQQSTTALDVA